MSRENQLKYFCVGAGLGVAAGVLFAPKSGAETRQQIQSKALDSTGYLKNQAVGAVNAATDTAVGVANAATDTAVGVVNAATDAIDRGRETIRQQKTNLTAAVEAAKTAYNESVATYPSKS